MKTLFALLCLAFLFAACEEKHDDQDNSAHEKFLKNSEVAKANITNWEKEAMDYSQYAADFYLSGTGYGSPDSISLGDMKKMDAEFMAKYDFKIASDSIILLPGVDPATKKMDGSVRHYISWEVTLPKTDSTEARSGVIHLYEYFVFDEAGKISNQGAYGDFGGLMDALEDDDDDDGDD